MNDETQQHSGASRRFPTQVYGRGSEPDPRFTLANERTYLAWLRTALAIIAGGAALLAIPLPVHPGLQRTSAIVVLAVGVVVPVLAWTEWARTETAMRLGRPLPGSWLSAVILVAVVLTPVLLLIGLALR